MEQDKEKQLDNEPLGTWHMGTIALFGALLMKEGIVGEEKENLKKLMYRALKAPKEI